MLKVSVETVNLALAKNAEFNKIVTATRQCLCLHLMVIELRDSELRRQIRATTDLSWITNFENLLTLADVSVKQEPREVILVHKRCN